MTFYNRILRLPRPRTFLYLMSLRTGTELSTLALLLNKVSGLYGLLALLTGLHLSGLQLSMYIYSVFALILVSILSPHIRTQSPFECLALATFFILDTCINAAYTTAFGISWFLVLSQKNSEEPGAGIAGGKTIDETAGFTSPEFNVSHVEVVAAPDQGVPGETNEAITAGYPHLIGARTVRDGVLQAESMSSITVILALWAVRVYLVLIVMSYARLVLRRHIMATAGRNIQLHSGSKDRGMLEDPFAVHLPEGKGWKGRVGRFTIRMGRSYWLNSEEVDEGWMGQEMGARINNGSGRKGSRSTISNPVEAPGVVERERRRRSGTGPPPPVALPLMQGQQPPQHSRLQEVRDGK